MDSFSYQGCLWWAQESNFYVHGHAPGGTFEIGTQIILLQIYKLTGSFIGWILDINPLKDYF